MRFQKGNKGGTGGSRAGAGRKPSRVRALCEAAFRKRIPILCKIADSDEERTRDRIAAIHELARIGVPERHEHTGENGSPIRTENTTELILDRVLADADAARLLGNLARRMACKPGGDGEPSN